MTDDFGSIPEPPQDRPVSEPAETQESAASREAWNEVVRSLDHLGNAVTAWARSAGNTEENRRRASMLRDQLEGAGRRMGEAVDSASKSDFAQHLGKAATGTGEVFIDAARKFSEEVGPHLAGAFFSAAEGVIGLGRKKAPEAEPATPGGVEAGARVEQPPAAPHPPAPPAPYEPGEEPPAPAPSGVPEDYTP